MLSECSLQLFHVEIVLLANNNSSLHEKSDVRETTYAKLTMPLNEVENAENDHAFEASDRITDIT